MSATTSASSRRYASNSREPASEGIGAPKTAGRHVCLSTMQYLCLSIYPSVCLTISACLSVFHSISAWLTVHLFVWLSLHVCLPVYLSNCVRTSVCLFFLLSLCLSVYSDYLCMTFCLSSFFMFNCPSVHLTIFSLHFRLLSVSLYPSWLLSACLSVCLSAAAWGQFDGDVKWWEDEWYRQDAQRDLIHVLDLLYTYCTYMGAEALLMRPS